MADLIMPDNHNQVNTPQEPTYQAGYVFYDDPLQAVRNLCESLPDCVEPGQGGYWVETVNVIHAIVCDALEAAQRDGGAK